MPVPTMLIRFFFVHKRETVPDDELVVRRVPPQPTTIQPLFELEFTTALNDNRRVTYRTYMTREQVEEHIHSTLKSLRADTDPFSLVQVSSSIYPSFMYDVDRLGWETRDTIMRIVTSSLASNVTRVRLIESE